MREGRAVLHSIALASASLFDIAVKPRLARPTLVVDHPRAVASQTQIQPAFALPAPRVISWIVKPQASILCLVLFPIRPQSSVDAKGVNESLCWRPLFPFMPLLHAHWFLFWLIQVKHIRKNTHKICQNYLKKNTQNITIAERKQRL